MKVTEEDRALLDAIEAFEVHDDEAALMACELIAAHRQSAERRALERAAECLEHFLDSQNLKLLAGEMTAQEVRTVKAVLRNRATAIRALGDE